MPKALAICIEDLDARPDAPRYVRCVALPGRQPGLRLDEAGSILWRSEAGVSCELWVSADGRLIVYRPEGGAPVTLHRAGRSLDVPYGKPVVAIDQDQVDVGARHLRIHVHGEAGAVAAPEALPPAQPATPSARSRAPGRLAQKMAAAAAIAGAVAAAGGCTDIEVRLAPPEVAPVTPTIDVRDMPPEPPAPTPEPTIEIRETPPIAVTLTPTMLSRLADSDEESALETARDWARLAPLPASAVDLDVRAEGSAFTRAFRVTFRAPSADVAAWLVRSPGTSEVDPRRDGNVRTYVIAPGGGAAYAEVVVEESAGGMSLVRVYTFWS